MVPKKNAEQIFNQAIEIADPKHRIDFLEEACGGDEKLRAQVDALLKWHTEAGDFLEVPAVDPDLTLQTSVAEGSGTVIGYDETGSAGRDGVAFSADHAIRP